MEQVPVFDRFKEIMETVEDCFRARRVLPALILLYTLIDSISWLAASTPNTSRLCEKSNQKNYVGIVLCNHESVGSFSGKNIASVDSFIHMIPDFEEVNFTIIVFTQSPSVRKRFTRWVDDWMLKSGSLPCTSLEIYAARCGVLHSLTSDSDLSAVKKARRILYSFRDESASPLQEVANRLNPNEFVALRVEDLYDTFRNGLIAFLEDTIQSPSKRAVFDKRAARHFSYLQRKDIDSALSHMKKA